MARANSIFIDGSYTNMGQQKEIIDALNATFMSYSGAGCASCGVG